MRLHADSADTPSQAGSYLETRDEGLHMWHLGAPAASLKIQSEIVFPPYGISLHMIQFEHKKSIWQSMIQTLILDRKNLLSPLTTLNLMLPQFHTPQRIHL